MTSEGYFEVVQKSVFTTLDQWLSFERTIHSTALENKSVSNAFAKLEKSLPSDD